MNHWPFILAAYGITAVATLALVLSSLAAMLRAETRAESLGKGR